MHKKSSLRCLTLAAATAGALALAVPAQATPSLATIGYASTPAGGDNVHIVSVVPSVNRDILAGGFVGTQTDLLGVGTSTILFWCFELDEFFSPGTTYTDYIATTVTPSSVNTALEALFTEVFHGAPITQPLDDLTSAAFQLAVWEIRYDSGGPYNLSSGNFTASGGSLGSLAAAQNMLNHLADPGNQPSRYVVTLLHSEIYQDFVTATPRPPRQTPEPSALPLLGAAVAAMLFARRRRVERQV